MASAYTMIIKSPSLDLNKNLFGLSFFLSSTWFVDHFLIADILNLRYYFYLFFSGGGGFCSVFSEIIPSLLAVDH